MASLYAFIGNVITEIIQPLVTLLFALALMFFSWGAYMFIAKAGDPKGRDIGRQHMIWGFVGIFIMVSIIAILNVVTNTFCGTDLCR